MKKTILNYGLISGAVATALMLISATIFHNNEKFGFEYGAIIGYAGILLSTLFVFLGVKSYRDNVGGGVINFGTAFQVGILITVISCVCYVLTWMVVSETLMPDFMEKYMNYSLEHMKNAGETAEKIEAQRQMMLEYKAMYDNPLSAFAVTFLEPFPIGLLVTFISAFVLRRKAA